MMWVVRKLGWAQAIVYLIILAIACWGVWLPYFVPILSVHTKDPTREGDDFIVEVESYKYLPCHYVGGRAFLQADNALDEPVKPVNFFTGATLTKGLLWAGLPDDTYTGLPLWFPFETKLRTPLPERLRNEPLDTVRIVLVLSYRCNAITGDFQQIVSIPAKRG